MSKPKTYNVYATGSELVSASSDKMTIKIAGRRGEKDVCIRLRISSYAMSKLASAGRKGIAELKDQSQNPVDYLANRLEKYGRAE